MFNSNFTSYPINITTSSSIREVLERLKCISIIEHYTDTINEFRFYSDLSFKDLESKLKKETDYKSIIPFNISLFDLEEIKNLGNNNKFKEYKLIYTNNIDYKNIINTRLRHLNIRGEILELSDLGKDILVYCAVVDSETDIEKEITKLIDNKKDKEENKKYLIQLIEELEINNYQDIKSDINNIIDNALLKEPYKTNENILSIKDSIKTHLNKYIVYKSYYKDKKEDYSEILKREGIEIDFIKFNINLPSRNDSYILKVNDKDLDTFYEKIHSKEKDKKPNIGINDLMKNAFESESPIAFLFNNRDKLLNKELKTTKKREQMIKLILDNNNFILTDKEENRIYGHNCIKGTEIHNKTVTHQIKSDMIEYIPKTTIASSSSFGPVITKQENITANISYSTPNNWVAILIKTLTDTAFDKINKISFYKTVSNTNNNSIIYIILLLILFIMFIILETRRRKYTFNTIVSILLIYILLDRVYTDTYVICMIPIISYAIYNIKDHNKRNLITLISLIMSIYSRYNLCIFIISLINNINHYKYPDKLKQ